MGRIIFATNNQNKVEEIKAVVGDRYEIVSLREAGIEIDIPEPYESLEENATAKSRTIYKLSNQDCFSEDTGLEVEALNGEPGVKSARYAGEGRDFKDNVDKLLGNLVDKTNRRVQFRTVISLIINGNEHFFEGVCTGEITEFPRGKEGFGYDPVFVPDGSTKTFAEMNMAEKNMYSHRQKATAQLLAFLSQYWKKTSL